MLAPPGVEAGPLAIRPVAQPGLRPRGVRGLRLGGRCVLVGGRTAVPGTPPLAARQPDGPTAGLTPSDRLHPTRTSHVVAPRHTAPARCSPALPRSRPPAG